jgi:hypothetical protein
LHGKHRLLYMPHQQLMELYDVEQDPVESVNLADQKPQLAAELLVRLIQTHKELPQ